MLSLSSILPELSLTIRFVERLSGPNSCNLSMKHRSKEVAQREVTMHLLLTNLVKISPR
jgi:hypothetical protein